MVNIKDVAIDKELKEFFPPLKPGARALLVKSVKRWGFQKPLIVSDDGTLIDGHNSHDIWNVELAGDETKAPAIVVIPCATLDAKKEVAFDMNVGRRYLNDAQRVKYVLMQKPTMKAKAKKNKLGKGKVLQKSEKLNVQKELAQLADVSHDTLNKVERVLDARNKSVIAQMLAGDISINAAYKTVSPPKPKPKKSRKKQTAEAPQRDHAASPTDGSSPVHEPLPAQEPAAAPQPADPHTDEPRTDEPTQVNTEPPNPAVDSGNRPAKEKAEPSVDERVSALESRTEWVWNELDLLMGDIRASAPFNLEAIEKQFERLHTHFAGVRAASIQFFRECRVRNNGTDSK